MKRKREDLEDVKSTSPLNAPATQSRTNLLTESQMNCLKEYIGDDQSGAVISRFLHGMDPDRFFSRTLDAWIKGHSGEDIEAHLEHYKPIVLQLAKSLLDNIEH